MYVGWFGCIYPVKIGKNKISYFPNFYWVTTGHNFRILAQNKIRGNSMYGFVVKFCRFSLSIGLLLHGELSWSHAISDYNPIYFIRHNRL